MKKNYFVALMATALLFSCTKIEIEENIDTTKYNTISLDEIITDYDAALLSLFSKNIRIDFGDYTRDFKSITKKENAAIDDNNIIYMSEDDSITVIKSVDGISILACSNKGEENIYYVSKSKDEIINIRERISKSARNNEEAVITIINDNAIHVKPTSVSQAGGKHISKEVDPKELDFYRSNTPKASTRRKNEINIWILRVSGYNYLEHEIYWQINDARHAVHCINPHVKLNFHIRHSNFHKSNTARTTLNNLIRYVHEGRNHGHEWSSRTRQDIFIAASWDIYYGDVVKGLAHINSYDINSDENFLARGVVGMNPAGSSKTLAHELLHILGADHNNTMWYEGWWIFKFPYADLMNNTHLWLLKRAYTKNQKSINDVRYRTTLR